MNTSRYAALALACLAPSFSGCGGPNEQNACPKVIATAVPQATNSGDWTDNTGKAYLVVTIESLAATCLKTQRQVGPDSSVGTHGAEHCYAIVATAKLTRSVVDSVRFRASRASSYAPPSASVRFELATASGVVLREDIQYYSDQQIPPPLTARFADLTADEVRQVAQVTVRFLYSAP